MGKLREFSVGDTVVLKGAGIEKVSALFIGKMHEEYFLLYRSKQDFESGKFWEHAASGSHQAERAR